MTAIYLLRHPQTVWNAEQRYQGRLEAPISPEGRVQARLVARAFAGSPLAAVYSSPLGRALYLARELAHAADAPLIVDQRLTEIGQTPWEGLYLSEIRERYPDLYGRWHSCPAEVRFPQGESLSDVQERASSALAGIFREHSNCHIAVVTHSVVVQVLVAAALALGLCHIHKVPVHNAGITTLCGDGIPGSLLTLNAVDALYHSPVAVAAACSCVS